MPSLFRSVRFKFPFYVMLPVVVVILLTAASLFFVMARQTFELRSKAFERNIRATASNLQVLLSGPERVARHAALLLEGGHPVDLETTLEASPDVQGIILAGRGGSAAHVHRVAGNVERSKLEHYEKADWFAVPARTQDPTWSGPEDELLHYSVPYRRDGRLAGVVSVEIAVADVRKALQLLRPNNSEFLLVNREGKNLLSSADEPGGNAWSDFRARLQARETGQSVVDTPNGKALAASVAVPGTPWGLGAWNLLDVLLVESHKRETAVVYSQLLLGLVIAIAVWLITRWLTKPLVRLKDEIESFGQGSLLTPRTISQQDEIGDLGRAFHSLIGVLQNREDHIRELESQRFNHLVANVPGVVFRYDYKVGVAEFVSEGVLALIGLTVKEVMLLDSLRQKIHPEDRAKVEAAVLGAIQAHSPWFQEYRIEHADGRTRWVEERGRATYDLQDEPVYVDGILQDVTERKQLESELLQARLEADTANRAKSDFLANMSHEIRTPMNAVIGLTHLALQTDLNAKQQDYLTKVSSSAQSLLGIINEILDFSKIEAGQMIMEQVDFRLDEVLDGVLNLFAAKASEKSIELFLVPDPEMPTYLVGDPLRLSQVLVNLASNALKFTQHGEIVVRSKLLERNENGLLVNFSVADSGVGLTPDQVGRLFRSFSQADSSTTRKFGGTGLGLAICKRLVEMMGGEIGVESTPGQGSTFHFKIRLAEGQGPSAQVPASHLELRGRRVLVVDDNSMARTIMSELLTALSFEVKTVSSGPEAIEEIETHPDYAVVLMDWKMPRMSGIEASGAIRQIRPKGTGPAIIIVTNYGRDEARAQARKLDLEGFLVKPVTPSQLFDSIAAALGGEPMPQRRVRNVLRPGPNLAGVHILLVDDNAINQQVARELLEQAGAQVTTADNGQLALDALANDTFAAVLMDVQMPVMGGYEATRQIRSRAEYQDLPVIAMTADALAGDRERCLEAGMNDHMSKPIDPDVLYATLARWLKKAPPERPACLDQSDGLRRVGGNRTLYQKLLRDFKTQFGDVGERLTALADKADHRSLAQLAHSLAGVAGNLGMGEVHEGARTLEKTAGSPEQAAALQDLQGRLVLVLQGLPETQVLSTPAEPGPDLAQSLRELARLLERGDPAAQAKLPQLEAGLGQADDNWAKLVRQVDSFDMGDAVATLREIAASLRISLEEKP